MRSRLKGVLLDLSGTLHVGRVPINGAQDAVQRLLDAGLQVRMLTNSTKKCQTLLVEELLEMGFTFDVNHLFGTPVAARSLLEQQGLRPYMIIDPRLQPDFAGISQLNPNCVLVGLAPSEFHYDKLNQAFRLLLNGARLLALHKGKYMKEEGGLSLGPGPFVAALEFAAGVQAEVIGKPKPAFFRAALDNMGCKPAEVVMIGDDLHDDVGGAMQVGIRGFQVRTGKYLPKDDDDPAVQPDGRFDSVVEAVEYILESL